MPALRALAVLAAAVLLLVAHPSQAGAQAPRWEANLSGSRIQYDSLAPLNAPALSGILEWRRPALFGRLSAGVTGFQDAGWSFQGSGDVSRRLSPLGAAGPVHLEVAGHAAASRHSSGFDTSLGRLDARAHITTRAVGGWIGMGLAYAGSSLDTASVRTLLPQLGLWGRMGPLQGTVSYQRPALGDVAYDEWTATVAYSVDRIDFTGFTGFRLAPGSDARADDQWVGASAAIWLHERAALVAGGGRYASDVVQGLAGGDYFSIGIRLTPRRVRAVPEPALRSPIIYHSGRAGDAGITFEVPGQDSVQIAGDWNEWTPEPLLRTGSGAWALRSALAPGIYRFNLLVDGEWTVPEGFPSADDGFGGRVGLLIISGSGG